MAGSQHSSTMIGIARLHASAKEANDAALAELEAAADNWAKITSPDYVPPDDGTFEGISEDPIPVPPTPDVVPDFMLMGDSAFVNGGSEMELRSIRPPAMNSTELLAHEHPLPHKTVSGDAWIGVGDVSAEWSLTHGAKQANASTAGWHAPDASLAAAPTSPYIVVHDYSFGADAKGHSGIADGGTDRYVAVSNVTSTTVPGDHKVIVSGADTTAGVLEDKLKGVAAGNSTLIPVALTKENPAGNEDLRIDITKSDIQAAAGTTGKASVDLVHDFAAVGEIDLDTSNDYRGRIVKFWLAAYKGTTGGAEIFSNGIGTSPPISGYWCCAHDWAGADTNIGSIGVLFGAQVTLVYLVIKSNGHLYLNCAGHNGEILVHANVEAGPQQTND